MKTAKGPTQASEGYCLRSEDKATGREVGGGIVAGGRDGLLESGNRVYASKEGHIALQHFATGV